MRVSCLVAAAALIALSAGAAQAGIIYQTGFEAPDYSLGALTGQDGWQVFGGTVPAVTNAQAASGTQSAAVYGGLDGQSGPFHSDPSSATSISVSADIFLASSSNQGSWQFAALGSGLGPFFSGIDIGADGSVFAITQGLPVLASFSRDEWHNVEMRMNFVTKKYDLLLDHSVIGAGLAFCGDNSTCTAGIVDSYSDVFFDTFGSHTFNDTGFIDNVKVASVPEPATWALMLAGFAGLGGMLRARRTKLA